MATDRPTPTGPAAPELSIVESRVYRGGNVWSYTPAIHLVVDLGVLEGYPTDTLEGFTERLVELLPGLEGHTCSRGVKGGFVARLREGTWLGHVTEHVALQLQQEAGHDVRRGKTRAVKGVPGRYNVIYGYADESVGLAAGTLAVRLVNHLVRAEEGFDFPEELDLFLRRAQRTAFGPSTAAILEEAVSRDIPYIRLNTASLVQLGQGVHAQRIRATMTSKTGALAVDLAGDKDMTTRLLASAGLPVPKQETVRTADAAVAAARRIGYPVVVKPLDGNHGRGVCLDLQTEDEVRAGFATAEGESRRGYVIVESFVTGRDYRCLIVGGKMQAIAERVPAHVVGDATHTVAELVEITNADPRRGVGHEKVLTRIKLDAAATALVQEQGFALDDVPPEGQMVKLALTGNMSTGGISVDRTFDAHPDNIEIAEEAARMIGLDVAVVTNIAPDHLGMRGIDTLEQLADVKAVVVEAVPRDGFAVLNADDDLVRRMRRRCSGGIVWFSLQPPGTKVREFVDDYCRRGGRAVVLEPTDKGDMIVIKHGRRSMQLAWTHLLPSTFGGTAKFNVANSMAAAGAAFAAGAGLHEIRQGLRTFATSYYLSPGRMNQVNVNNIDVFVDYCHNAPGMRVLGDFVESYSAQKSGQSDLGKISRLGVIATAGDRRDDDMRELGAIAAAHFDVLVVREDERLRGRRRGECAELVAEGARSRLGEEGVRCRQVEVVLEEVEALHNVMARANPGDVVVLCVDKHAQVLAELEQLTQSAQAGAHTGGQVVSDPDLDPAELQTEAQVSGDEAGASADEELETAHSS